MRYFFHAYRNGVEYEDTEGTWHATPAEARAHAQVIAAELSIDEFWLHAWLSVADEQGQEIQRVQVLPPEIH